MSKKPVSSFQQILLLSQSILHDRDSRRKVGLQVFVLLFILFCLGVFVLDNWLAQSLIIFGIYWCVVFLLTCFMIFYALYDALRVLREEKSVYNEEMAESLRGLAKDIEEFKKDQELENKNGKN